MTQPHSEFRRTVSSYALIPLVLLVGGLAVMGALVFQGLARVGRRLVGKERIAVVIATTLVVLAVLRGQPSLITLASLIFWLVVAALILVRMEDEVTKFRPVNVKKTK